ncbi:MAG: carboxylating nicotinate-nucleotide diphosphorylase [Candidatus Diapherotrites archaeon]|nr:carboxylating nicotinate-nucleotide diphosphorylase [Candidatus Diapherotrites archaeon]
MLALQLRQKLLAFAREDIGGLDVTSVLLLEKNCFAKVVARENCVLAGAEEAAFLFSRFGARTVFRKKDGSFVKKGQTVLHVSGLNKRILSVERTALNVLGRMSGLATICSKASKIAGKKTKVFLTRKTMPGFNLFDKKACAFGGVFPHRKNLRESILIKENHLQFEGIPEILQKARGKKQKLRLKEIEIEVESLNQAVLAAESGAEVILLDNFSPKKARAAIKEIRCLNKRIIIELSGSISLKNLKQYVSLGADRVSMGQLSKEAKMIDFSLEMVK